MNLNIGLLQRLNVNMGAEYLRLTTTTGSHRLVNGTFGIDFSFDHGVKVWSEQISVSTGLEYLFQNNAVEFNGRRKDIADCY